MSNYRNAVRRRAHKERAPPASRQHFGILEKRSDYLLRARNYHSKQDRLNQLREAARLRNPDEFYHRMEREGEGTKDGRHIIERKGTKRSFAQLKVMKEADLNYAHMQSQQEGRKIDKLRENLQGLEDAAPLISHDTAEAKRGSAKEDDEEEEEDEPSAPSSSSSATRRHVIFTDSNPPSSFSPSTHFNTRPELLSRTYNRPTLSQLSSTPLTVNVPPTSSLVQVDRSRHRVYAELASRVARKDEVEREVARLERERKLMGKGRRRKLVVKDQFGDVDESQTLFVWKQERKK